LETEKEIKISNEADLDIKFHDGKLEIVLNYEGKLGGASISLFTDAAKLIDKITDLTPTEWDDRVIDPLVRKILAKKND